MTHGMQLMFILEICLSQYIEYINMNILYIYIIINYTYPYEYEY